MLLRSSTKRVLEVGEVASDSDEEVDESWIKQKHAEIIDDFTDVTSREKEFVKRWDAHVFAERIPANRYVAPSLMRFSYENHDFLQRRDMREEFFKFTSKLILEGTVHPDAVGTCMDIIKSAALPDKSQSSQDSKSASSVTLSSPRRPSQSAMELDHRDIFPPPKLRTDLSKAICPCGKQWKGSNVVICCGPNCPHKYFHDECVGLDGLGKFTRGWKCDVCASTR
ncbi:MAG: hypothetical protein M1833_006600 [Piccolia ochrophora]|nr:MAG: hypothetical protein M1833_006600 [Piccolia ochrophora]